MERVLARPLITLTTDYGTSDVFVAVMKGVILSINPEANILDITHEVLPHDILDGALAIGNAYRYFPPKTVHVVVVDPGVGTERRPILVAADQHYLIAPDNGVLSSVYDQSESLHVWNLISEHYFRQPLSKTFHGRDVFAPVAAWLTKSWQTSSFGEPITDFVRFTMPKVKVEGASAKGVVLRADHFGNLITNITPENVPGLLTANGNLSVTVGQAKITKMVQTFAEGVAGEPVVLIGSSGYLEISVNRGNAAKTVGAGRGAEVVVDVSHE